MGNPGILGWRAWSRVRKAQVVMALVGALATVATDLVIRVAGDLGTYDSFGTRFYFVWDITMWPALSVADLLNHPLTPTQFTFSWLVLASLLNALLLSTVATLAGWVWRGWRAWSRVRKAQVVMALLGALVTVGITLIFRVAGELGASEGAGITLWFVWARTMFPAALVAHLLHLSINLSKLTFAGLVFASTVNALLLAIPATLVGWVWERFRKSKNPVRL